tara:strand:- start:5 stop:241 length:237 start_codon:yes stop_codon:yes gene_type:complete
MKHTDWVVESLKNNVCASDLTEKMAYKLADRYTNIIGYDDVEVYREESLYSILGGDGISPVYMSEGTWVNSDGSFSDD